MSDSDEYDLNLRPTTKLWSALDLNGRRAVAAYFSDRLSILRRINDGVALTEQDTMMVRGAIAECKRVIDAAKTPTVDDDEDDGRPNAFA